MGDIGLSWLLRKALGARAKSRSKSLVLLVKLPWPSRRGYATAAEGSDINVVGVHYISISISLDDAERSRSKIFIEVLAGDFMAVLA